MKFSENTCFIGSIAMIVEVWSMLSHENSVSLRFFHTCRLNRFISYNSDSSVETFMIIANTCAVWHHHGLNACLL